jgi:hypothetical protein
VQSIGAGGRHSLAILHAAAVNQRTGAHYVRLDDAILAALPNDVLLTPESGADQPFIDYGTRQFEIRGTTNVVRPSDSTTLFGAGCSLTAAANLQLDGTVTCPPNAVTRIGAGESLLLSGQCTVLPGGSLQVLPTTKVAHVDGRLNVIDGALLAPRIEIGSGGSLNLVESSIVGFIETLEGSQTSVSGTVLGNMVNSGRILATGDTNVVGDLANQTSGELIAQVGVIYITGDLTNNGTIVGAIVDAPPLADGGGTQSGDGVRIGGSLSIGPEGQLRFIEDLWKFSVCGDMTLACAADDVRFNGAKLSLDGCEGTMQTFEATSADLGCVAAAFSGEETTVSLIGELDVASGATVTLVDHFNNAPGKAAEVVYARGLTVKPGATLVTNGIKVVTRNALIQGTVDDMSNICVVVDAPDPDVNGDGLVNGIDLAFILTYWGSSAPIADLDDDGIVGGADLTIVLSGWTN